MDNVTIASIQPPFFDTKSVHNNERIIERGFALLELALKKDTSFCCLPEYFNVFGLPSEEIVRGSSNSDNILNRAKALAEEYQSFIVLPMIVCEEGCVFNRAFLIDSKGTVQGYYDKVHLTETERELLSIVPGNEIKVFETVHGVVGIVICYDIYFPELFASLAKLEPDLIFFPSLQRSDHELASEAMLKARAMDTQAYIVRSSFGRQSHLSWEAGMIFGQSCIVHPDGTILANAGHYEGFAIANACLPANWQRQRCSGCSPMEVRKFLFQDKRPEVYHT